MIRVWKTKDTCHKPYCDLEQLNCHLEGSTSYGHYFLICLIPTRVVLFSCAGFILITLLHSNFQFVPKTNTHVTKRDTYIITQNAQRCIFIEKRKWKYDVIERFTTQVFFIMYGYFLVLGVLQSKLAMNNPTTYHMPEESGTKVTLSLCPLLHENTP